MKVFWVGVLVLGITVSASADEVYGTITHDGGQPLSGEPIRIVCDGGRKYEGVTGERGSYSIYVQQTGSCTLYVRVASTQLSSYDDPVKYDFDFSGDQLRRR